MRKEKEAIRLKVYSKQSIIARLRAVLRGHALGMLLIILVRPENSRHFLCYKLP